MTGDCLGDEHLWPVPSTLDERATTAVKRSAPWHAPTQHCTTRRDTPGECTLLEGTMRCLHWLSILALVAPLCFGLIAASTAIADPPAPDQATAISTLRPDEAGTKTINVQTGAASYSYPFTLPPARGVGPTLALHYSSSGP